jgi:hypothetical protein
MGTGNKKGGNPTIAAPREIPIRRIACKQEAAEKP